MVTNNSTVLTKVGANQNCANRGFPVLRRNQLPMEVLFTFIDKNTFSAIIYTKFSHKQMPQILMITVKYEIFLVSGTALAQYFQICLKCYYVRSAAGS